MKLKEQVAVVTGGGRGIGRAVALAFARQGAQVAVMARTASQLDEVVASIQAEGGQGLAIPCDVTDPAAVEQAMDEVVRHWGKLTLLVNNAGGALVRKKLWETEPELWRTSIEVNLLGTFHCCRYAVPHMIRSGGGKIINVGSGVGHEPRPGNSAYCSAKAGVWMLTRCLALELWEHQIEVNEVVPGPVYTDLTAEIFDPTGKTPPLAPSERVKTPEDCVELFLFLASCPPGGPTGQSFSLARRPL